MKSISAIALFVASTFIAAGTVMAQDHVEKATIPFTFKVGRLTLPAGNYTVRSTTTMPDVLILDSPENKVHVMTLGQPNQYDLRRVDNLEFHQYGAQYFLSEIHSSNSAMNIHFATTKAEKSVRAQTLEARNHVADPVLIALK